MFEGQLTWDFHATTLCSCLSTCSCHSSSNYPSTKDKETANLGNLSWKMPNNPLSLHIIRNHSHGISVIRITLFMFGAECIINERIPYLFVDMLPPDCTGNFDFRCTWWRCHGLFSEDSWWRLFAVSCDGSSDSKFWFWYDWKLKVLNGGHPFISTPSQQLSSPSSTFDSSWAVVALMRLKLAKVRESF